MDVCDKGTYCDLNMGACVPGCVTAEGCPAGALCDIAARQCFADGPVISKIAPGLLPKSGGSVVVTGGNFRAGTGLIASIENMPVTITISSENTLTAQIPMLTSCGTKTLTLAYPNGVAASAPIVVGPCTLSVARSGFSGPPGSAAGSLGRVQIADLTQDGILDVLFTDLSQAGLYLARGDGRGAFPMLVKSQTSSNAYTLAIADYDKDGKLDVPLRTASGVQLYTGDSAGVLSPGLQRALSPLVGSQSLAADFNGDGAADLPLILSSSLQIAMGGAPTPFQLILQTGISDAVNWNAGDFDRDGKTDLVICQSAGATYFVHGQGDGTFSGSMKVGSSLCGAAGDINNDGILDLLPNAAAVHLGAGNGTFNQKATGLPFRDLVAAADFNQDGILDFVAASRGQRDASLYLGVGDGTFTNSNLLLSSAESVYSLAIGDLDKNGIPDVVLGNFGTSNQSQAINVFLFTGQ